MIRRAEPKDADAVFDLAKRFATSFFVEETIFRASFTASLTDRNTYCVVAETKSRVVGYILAFKHTTFYANGNVVWVEEIMVDATYRNQGFGTALMQNVEEWAKQEDCKLIALATRRAAGFYEATGYQASATYFRKLTQKSVEKE